MKLNAQEIAAILLRRGLRQVAGESLRVEWGRAGTGAQILLRPLVPEFVSTCIVRVAHREFRGQFSNHRLIIGREASWECNPESNAAARRTVNVLPCVAAGGVALSVGQIAQCTGFSGAPVAGWLTEKLWHAEGLFGAGELSSVRTEVKIHRQDLVR
jgi:hypothetical protein